MVKLMSNRISRRLSSNAVLLSSSLSLLLLLLATVQIFNWTSAVTAAAAATAVAAAASTVTANINGTTTSAVIVGMAMPSTTTTLTGTRTGTEIATERGTNRETETGATMIGGAAAATIAAGSRPSTPPKVKVNKCCHFSEHLDRTQSCVPGNSKHWMPLIFLINKRHYYSIRGEKPKFIVFEENVRPIDESDISITTTTSIMDTNQDENGPGPGPGHEHKRGGGAQCTSNELEMFTTNIVLFSNGSLYLQERSQFIEPHNFCVDQGVALVCFPEHKTQPPRVKVKKCCGPTRIYSSTAKDCNFAPANDERLALPINASDFHTIYGFPKCIDATTSFAIAGDMIDAQLDNSSGALKLHSKNFTVDEYCLEHVRSDDDDGKDENITATTATTTTATTTTAITPIIATNNKTTTTVKVFACLHHFAADVASLSCATTRDDVQFVILSFCIIVSVIFLAATLFASSLIPSVHHMLHWRCQIYYVFCLFVGDVLMSYTLMANQRPGTAFCTFVASAMHFFFLSAFFWLNTMCFNIWWTFRDFRPSSLERNQELFRLRLYSAYAWGVPLLIAAIALCIDLMPETELLRPGFGICHCWFSNEGLGLFAYFFGPIGILLCANIALFISTTHQLTCGLWKRDDVKSTTEKKALGKVWLKLVIVMGVTWIAEVLSWLIGGPDSAWFFTDLINALQGVFIFLVIGCQPQVWSAIKRQFSSARQEITNTTNGVHHSSSSHGLPSLTACGETTQNTSLNTSTGTTAKQMKIPMETVC